MTIHEIYHHNPGDYKYDWIDIRFDPVPKSWIVIGVDPGTVHLGLARLHVSTGCGYLYQVTFKDRLQDPIKRMGRSQMVLSRFFHGVYLEGEMVIEGASFADRYRQTELAEIRAAIALWGVNEHLKVQFIPPNTIRKQVFGNGRTKATDYWPSLASFPDAAAALSCALYTQA